MRADERVDERVDERGRATIQDAARILGISEGAVRKRVDRGTLGHEKGEDGRVYVRIPDRDDGVHPDAEVQGSAELVENLKAQVEYLREEMLRRDEVHQEEARRKDHIIAGLVQRVPELEASEARQSHAGASQEAPQTSQTGSRGSEDRDGQADAQTDSQRRWWEFWK